MPQRKPSQRRKPEETPQPPRDRLAEIRAEIQDVQQQIETKRRVDLDTCIFAMAMTAKDMNPKYKETSEAGLAALVLC